MKNPKRYSRKTRDILLQWQQAKVRQDSIDLFFPVSVRTGEEPSAETLSVRDRVNQEFYVALQSLKEIDEPELMPLIVCIHQPLPDVNIKTRDGYATFTKLATERGKAMQKLVQISYQIEDLFPLMSKAVQ
jgi:hypothetical protein